MSYKLNSVALVRRRTIPTERPQPVGEVSANFELWTLKLCSGFAVGTKIWG
jgi:hypothetical protein